MDASTAHECLVGFALYSNSFALNRSNWARWLAALDVRQPPTQPGPGRGQRGATSRRAVTSADLKPLIELWQAQHWLLEQPPGHYNLHPDPAHQTLSDERSREVLQQAAYCLDARTDPAPMYGQQLEHWYHQRIARARAALYLGDAETVGSIMQALYARFGDGSRHADFDPWLDLISPETSAPAFRLLPLELQLPYAAHTIECCLRLPLLPCAALIDDVVAANDPQQQALRIQALQLACLGKTEPRLAPYTDDASDAQLLEVRALIDLRAGDFASCRARLLTALAHSRGPKGGRKPRLQSPLAPLLTLVLATGEGEAQAAAHQLLQQASKRQLRNELLGTALLLGNQHPTQSPDYSPQPADWQQTLTIMLASAFLGECPDRHFRERWREFMGGQAVDCAKVWLACGADWLSAQAWALAAHYGQPPAPEGLAPSLGLEGAPANLLGLFRARAPWEQGLEQLEALAASHAPPASAPAQAAEQREERLVFLLKLEASTVGEVSARFHTLTTEDCEVEELNQALALYDELLDDAIEEDELEQDEDTSARPPTTTTDPVVPEAAPLDEPPVTRWYWQIAPRMQKRRKQGWSGGRNVALRKLAEDMDSFPWLTPADRKVAGTLRSRRTWNGGREYFFGSQAPLSLVGHPHVYDADAPETPLEVSAVEPAVEVVATAAGWRLRICPPLDRTGLGIHRDGPARITVCKASGPQLQAAALIEQLPPVPDAGEERLQGTLARLAGLFTVHAPSLSAGSSAAGNIDTVTADPRPVALLKRLTPGLQLRVGVQPLGPQAPTLHPGRGLSVLSAEIDGVPQQCTRDLKAEQHALTTVAEQVPELKAAQAGPVTLQTLGPCLELLERLQAAGTALLIQWSDGTPLQLDSVGDNQRLRLRLREQTGWLELNGDLRVDEDQVLSLAKLLEQRVDGSRFVQLDGDRYLALTEELKRQLLALQYAGTPAQGALRVPPVALGFANPWLHGLAEQGQLDASQSVRQRLSYIEQIYALTPPLPRAFQAQLRPYQLEGYHFLSRLAYIGAGAILADDMGLGKTLMTLALLTARAVEGPALVVAPLSVKRNWHEQARRFAPTLHVRDLDQWDPTQAPQPFDVLVCSYTVMTQRIDILAPVQWATVVLDEAQAIKNAATQRSKAAQRLSTKAPVALTGTPLENHLGDLFGLMQFLNPGLLGSAAHFETRFARPIQRDGCEATAEALRTLIGPFILRRRKVEVLQDLPPRSEIILEVELEAEEQAFVEALRRDALARLEASGNGQGASTITILSELTRLRRAACHPELADPSGAHVGAAKLERLVELLHELRAEGHRALVFSQFVDFLSIVRRRLEAETISYVYLDGSTSEAGRQRAVTAFQSGEGDAFLISLKAGGFGLNLTAADYVIHLDPWWNPAVEDQASDRAHRIGQQRPVTIYKLVNVGSIEQRVLALHARKRDLASTLLKDASQSAKLDPATLLSLLHDET